MSYRQASRFLSGLTFFIAVCALLGWIFKLPFLCGLFFANVAMNPLSAVCLMVLGWAAWREAVARRAFEGARFWGYGVALVCAARLASYAQGNYSILDQSLFSHQLAGNRMAPMSAVCFILSGLAIGGVNYKTRRGFYPYQFLALIVVPVSGLAVLNYVYKLVLVAHTSAYFPMAANTAIAFQCLSLAILLAHPDRGWMNLLTSASLGGVTARRLLPVAIIVPILFGILRLYGQHAGFYETEFGTALFVVSVIFVFTALSASTASALNEIDVENNRREKQLGLQFAVARILAKSETFQDATPQLIQAIAQALDCPLGSLWRPDAAGRQLDCLLFWHHPEFLGSALERVSMDMHYGRGQGLPGRVWASKEPFWLENIEQARHLPRTRYVEEDGLNSAFAFPVMSGDQVLAVFEFFARENRTSDDMILKVLNTLGDQVGQFIDRCDAQGELQKARDAALESSRYKSEFMANMSHEIRTPMNAIIGMTELLLESSLTADQKDCAQTVQQSGAALLLIVNDILDLSKIEAGKLRVEAVDFNVGLLLEDVAAMLMPRARTKGIAVVCAIDEDVPAFLRGDPARLRQVLTNLMGNAIKFTEKGEVAVRVTGENATEEGLVLRFSVKDTGIGISEEACKRLFQSFSQADNSTTRRFGGTGLGLAISKRLVELMDGEIGNTSALGKGSCFWFTLPLQKALHAPNAPQAVKPPVSAPPVPLKKERLLLVEDNLANQKVALRFLEKQGYGADVAVNGREACKAAAAGNYALILMDCQMPEMDGYQATAAIRAMEGTLRHTPIVALTAHALEEEREKCLAAGMDDYLCKPLTREGLRLILERWLNVSAPVRPSEAGLVDEQRWLDISDGSPEALNHLMGVFLNQMRENLDRLSTAIASNDVSTMVMTAHGALGSSLNFGVIGMAEPLKALEKIGESGRLMDAAPHLAQANLLFRSVEQHWTTYQKNHALAA